MLQGKHLGTWFINQNKISKFGYHDHCNQMPILRLIKLWEKKKNGKYHPRSFNVATQCTLDGS